MASQRPKFTIQVNGADGDSAYMEYSYRPRGAPKYQDGVDGRPAREAGAGGAAGHLSVQLSASTVARGGIHVEGTGAWQGRSWEISPGHDIFLSARGGTGGKGGKGEDGQDGGRGQNGEDATRWTKATVCTLCSLSMFCYIRRFANFSFCSLGKGAWMEEGMSYYTSWTLSSPSSLRLTLVQGRLWFQRSKWR